MSKQEIYNRLRSAGLTREGALAMMGNWECESNLEANRVQWDYSPLRTDSKNYTRRILLGQMSKEQFASDQKGYGLAQWTLAYRKRKLWDFWKSSGKEIDDPILQTDFALSELATEGEYAGLFKMLKTSNNIEACSDAICSTYERPAINNFKDRRNAALDLEKHMIDGQVEEDPVEADPNSMNVMPTHEFWPPRVLCKGMRGTDVEVMTALLKVRGYGVHYVTPEFGSFVEEKIKAFQADKGLKADGICGPLTWGKLLERGG